MANKTFRVPLEKLGGVNPSEYIGKPGDIFFDPTNPVLKVANGAPGGASLAGGSGSTGDLAITGSTIAAPQDEDLTIATSSYVMASPPGVYTNEVKLLANGVFEVPYQIQGPYGINITATNGDVNLEAIAPGHIEIGYQNPGCDIYVGSLGSGTTLRLHSDYVSIISDVPQSSKGSQGDTPGCVAFNSSYAYFCTGTYNGIADIWKRVALTGGAW